jgi:hypothetical protein
MMEKMVPTKEPKFPAVIHIVVLQGIQAQQLTLHQEFLRILKRTQQLDYFQTLEFDFISFGL